MLVLQSVHINFAKEDCVCVCKTKRERERERERDAVNEGKEWNIDTRFLKPAPVVPLPLLCSGITNEDTIYEIFNISETVVLSSYV